MSTAMFLLILRQIILDDSAISLLGMVAAVLTTASFVPQLIKAYRTKKMDDVSPYLMCLFMTGTFLWMVYGVYRSDLVIVVANAVATTFNALLLHLKYSYRRKSIKQF